MNDEHGRARRLTDDLWGSIVPIYDAILDHPFVQGLSTGDLPVAAFRFYVVQDAHFLREYARALALTAAKAPTEATVEMFGSHAAGVIAVERQLHDSLLADFRLSTEQVASTPMAPTNVAYTSFLLAATAQGSFAECLGAILPCYWVYWEVGKALLRAGSTDPLYQRWIDAYGGDDFGRLVEEVLDLTDEVGLDIGRRERDRVVSNFVTTSRYEWMFWDAGWRQESWPV